MCKKFDGWNLDSRLQYFFSQADRRIRKIAASFIGPSYMTGVKNRKWVGEAKSKELMRRFLKNRSWADYCKNRRYELAGL